MKKDNLNEIYLETIYPIKDNKLTVSYIENNKSRNIIFNLFNADNIIPAIYKNVSIFYSAMNKDIFHTITRSNNRTSKKYNHTDFLFIAQKTFDYYLLNHQKSKFNSEQTFYVHSKSHSDIIVPIQINKNKLSIEDKMSLSETYGKLFYSQYFLFIYTTLKNTMSSHNSRDIEITVENKQNNIINIKVD